MAPLSSGATRAHAVGQLPGRPLEPPGRLLSIPQDEQGLSWAADAEKITVDVALALATARARLVPRAGAVRPTGVASLAHPVGSQTLLPRRLPAAGLETPPSPHCGARRRRATGAAPAAGDDLRVRRLRHPGPWASCAARHRVRSLHEPRRSGRGLPELRGARGRSGPGRGAARAAGRGGRRPGPFSLATRRASAAFSQRDDLRRPERRTVLHPSTPPSPRCAPLEWTGRRGNLVVCGSAGTGKRSGSKPSIRPPSEPAATSPDSPFEALGVPVRRPCGDALATKAIARRADKTALPGIGVERREGRPGRPSPLLARPANQALLGAGRPAGP